MYGTAACPYCQAARALFGDLGVSFEEIRVDLEPSRREEMRQRAG
ncbi:MAG: glutaredoxin family protein, partial [Pseudomonadales bacterium]